MPMSCATPGPKDVLTHPYHEDYVVLPTRPIIRPDNENIERDIEYRQIYEDASASRWTPTSWINLLLGLPAGVSKFPFVH